MVVWPFQNKGNCIIQPLTRLSHELRGPLWHSPGLWWWGQCIWNYGDWIWWRSREDQDQQSERPKRWYTIRTCIMHIIVVSQDLTQREVGIETEQEGWGIARRNQIFKCQSRQPPFFGGLFKHSNLWPWHMQRKNQPSFATHWRFQGSRVSKVPEPGFEGLASMMH